MNEAEERKITAVNGNVLTLCSPLMFRHFAGVETYGDDEVEMRAEVGLLSRNIVFRGDDSSPST